MHTIKDMVFEASKLRDVITFNFILNKLGCTEYEAERALKRAQQLYPEIQDRAIEIKQRFLASITIFHRDESADRLFKLEFDRVETERVVNELNRRE